MVAQKSAFKGAVYPANKRFRIRLIMDPDSSPSDGYLIRDKILSLAKPVVMGILNTTPDSFSDGGQFQTREKALFQIECMVNQGAAIIDIGGESTRPGSDPVDESTELKRVLPVFEKATEAFPGVHFSIDTTKYLVAKCALEAGAHIINDVSGLHKEPRFADLCTAFNAGYVLMHTQGDPKTMQLNPVYRDVVEEVGTFFRKKIQTLEQAGLKNIIIDPGFGFGKKLEHNLKLINHLDTFTALGYPVLAGASRKSMIGQVLGNRPSDDRLAGTIAVHYHCLMNGAKILRVHDVQQAVDSVKLFCAIKES